MNLRRVVHRSGRSAKLAGASVVGSLAVGVIRGVRLFSRTHAANFVAGLMRAIGPRLKEHRIGREQLKMAFPEKSPAEIDKILAGVWDNLGRLAVEFAHIDRLHILDPERPGAEDIVYDQRTFDRFH